MIFFLGYGSAMATYIHAIPYMFYALVALIIVPLFIFGVIPKLGAMKSAYKRVEETGQVYSKESQKWNKNGNEEVDKEAKIVDFLFPILTILPNEPIRFQTGSRFSSLREPQQTLSDIGILSRLHRKPT